MTKKELEKKIEELEKRIKHLENPIGDFVPDYIGRAKPVFAPECLHNGCNHERNPVCNLACPHCSVIC